MASYLQTKAIVLSRRDVAEHDCLYTMMTEVRGKMEVRVRGARKILSKLVPPLASIGIVRVLVYEGRSRPLLIGIETVERFRETGETLWRSQVAARFLRLVELATRAESRDPELFNLLTDALHMAEHTDVAHVGALRDAFIIQLLSHAGYRPELDACVQCRSSQTYAFSAGHGGVVCRDCVRDDVTAVSLSSHELESLRAHASIPLAASSILPKHDIGAFTQAMLRYRLETPLWFPAVA